MTRAFIIVNMALGAVLVVVVLVVIAFTIILVVMWRGKKAVNSVALSHDFNTALRQIRKLQNRTLATRKEATNRVFESYHLTTTEGKPSRATEPMYHTLEPTTVMCNNLRPTEPVYNSPK